MISSIATSNVRAIEAPQFEGAVATRIKLAETGNVMAIVESDGQLHMGSKSVQVLIGGCGGE